MSAQTVAEERVRLFDEIADWGEKAFPNSTDHGRLTHLRRELEELVANPSSGEEMADIIMILCHQARAHGVDLWDELDTKFAICLSRQWGEPDPDGVVEHVR